MYDCTHSVIPACNLTHSGSALPDQVPRINVIWIQGQTCSGCTVSITNSSYPSIVDVLLGSFAPAAGLQLAYHQTIMPEWGDDALNILRRAEEGALEPFVLVVEGSVPDESKAGGGFWCMIGEENGHPVTFNDWTMRLSKGAAAIVAVGSCAAFGGWVHGKPNPTGAMGVRDLLGKDWKSKLGVPIINVPGCPPQGDWMTQVVGNLVLAVRGFLPLPELDEQNRPKFIFGKTVHENCPRAGSYSEGTFDFSYGLPNCVVALGCKGLIAHCDVPKRGWINHLGGCPNLGGPCIGCTEPEFPDEPFSPFLSPPPGAVMTRTVLTRVAGGIEAAYKLARSKP